MTECLGLVRTLIANPSADGAELQSAALHWLEEEGNRYFLLVGLRSLLEDITSATLPIDPAALLLWESRLLVFWQQVFPTRNPYLDPAIARDRLITLGLYTEDTAPSTSLLEAVLDRACDLVHQWLGRRLAITTYTTALESDRFGRIKLPVWPVLGVESLAARGPGLTSERLPLTPIMSYWQGDRIIYTGLARRAIEVTYTAGVDPLPEAINDCLLDLLMAVIAQDPTLRSVNWSWFNLGDYPVESVELPGGLRKSFAVSTGVALNSKPQPTQVDRILYPLAPWRVASVLC